MRLLRLPWLDEPEPRRLSPKEAQVVQRLAEGKKLGVIAAELGITPGTVDSHCLHIQKKWHVNTRPELYQKAAVGAGRVHAARFGLHDTVYLVGSREPYRITGQKHLTSIREPYEEYEYRLQGPHGAEFWIIEQHLLSAPAR
jgi:DNA-binding CsgD family transcriptional regulator